jgi:dipeptidyl aminopeptidase/acylaminoacyl peptidase
MKKLFYILALATALAAQAQVKNVPMRDFFRNPEKTRYQVSPDGQYISFLAPYENRLNIHIQKLGGGEVKRITSVKDRDIGSYFWKNNNSLIYIRDFGGDENFHLFIATTDGKTEKDLTPFENVRVSITDDLYDFEDEVLVEMNKRNPEVFDVFRLNIKTGEMKSVAENPGNVNQWITDHNGVIRLALTTDGVSTGIMYRATEKDEFKTVLTTDFRMTVAPLAFTFDNRYIYASSNIGRDKQAIVKMDPETGKELETVFAHNDVDVSGIEYSRKRKVFTMITYTTDKLQQKFLDAETEKMYSRIKNELKGYEIGITSHTKNEDKFLVRTYSDRSLGTYYIYDKTTDKLQKLQEISPWINEADMAPMKPVKYTTRDGITINGYLTLPIGKSAKNLPVIINPHGGPWARDFWGFNPEVQFLANRGYAVLQMNFRGSVGYGKQFWESSFKEWGKSMQNDITDGVKWLISEGIADPKKVAIYGASYGGYATLAGITFTPDLYACAIDYVGVSNLFTFMKTIPPYWKPYLEMMYVMVGNPEKDSVMMHNASPVFHVDKIKCPLLIAQGARDPRVNKDESDQIVDALKKRGIEVEYIVKDNEGHGFRNEENRFEFYGAMETFLGKHLSGN